MPRTGSDGGLLLDLARLAASSRRRTGTAWAGGPAGGGFTTAIDAHGLVTGFGDTGSVGIAGITLGGGVGYLVRKHGLTIDILLGGRARDRRRRGPDRDESHEPDLFWAIRGGGGNFGVVTRSSSGSTRWHVLGGMLPAGHAGDGRRVHRRGGGGA